MKLNAPLFSGIVLLLSATVDCSSTPRAVTPSKTSVGTTTTTSATYVQLNQDALQALLRTAMLDRVAWSRLYVMDIMSASFGADTTRARAMRAQSELGDVYGAFYGRSAGEQLTRMLQDGLVYEGETASAKAANDEDDAQRAEDSWYTNTSELADFFARKMPTINRQRLLDVLRTGNDDAMAEIEARVDGDYHRAGAFAVARAGQTLALADILAGAIVETFPGEIGPPPLDVRAQSTIVVLRDVLHERATLLHEYVVEATSALPDTEAAERRLMQNANAIAKPLGFYFGDPMGERFATVLRGETQDALTALDAALRGDPRALERARRAWEGDVERMAMLFARVNPTVNRTLLSRAMHAYVSDAIANAHARANGDWTADINSADMLRWRAIRIADILGGAIASQFTL